MHLMNRLFWEWECSICNVIFSGWINHCRLEVIPLINFLLAFLKCKRACAHVRLWHVYDTFTYLPPLLNSLRITTPNQTSVAGTSPDRVFHHVSYPTASSIECLMCILICIARYRIWTGLPRPQRGVLWRISHSFEPFDITLIFSFLFSLLPICDARLRSVSLYQFHFDAPVVYIRL